MLSYLPLGGVLQVELDKATLVVHSEVIMNSLYRNVNVNTIHPHSQSHANVLPSYHRAELMYVKIHVFYLVKAIKTIVFVR